MLQELAKHPPVGPCVQVLDVLQGCPVVTLYFCNTHVCCSGLALFETYFDIGAVDSRRRRSRIHPESEEGTPSDDASTPEEALPPGTKTSRGASREEVNPRDAAQQLQAPVSEEDAAFLEQQAPSTGRHHHSSALIAKLSLKREMKRQHDK